MLTSSREECHIIESHAFGNNSYTHKPVDFNQFADAVQKLGLHWLVLNDPMPDS
jgi:two-component system response regulator